MRCTICDNRKAKYSHHYSAREDHDFVLHLCGYCLYILLTDLRGNVPGVFIGLAKALDELNLTSISFPEYMDRLDEEGE